MSRQRKLQKINQKSKWRRSLREAVVKLAKHGVHSIATNKLGLLNTILIVVVLFKITALQAEMQSAAGYISNLYVNTLVNLIESREEFRAAVESILSLFGSGSAS